MANRLWPFGRTTESEKQQTPESLNLAIHLGSEYGEAQEGKAQDSSLQYYADHVSQNPIVAACLRELATSISSIELGAVEETNRGEYSEYYGPLADILKNPNPAQSQADWLIELTQHYFTFGNVYIYFERAGSKESAPVESLHLLNPLYVTIKTGNGADAINGIASYEYQPSQGRKAVSISPQNVAHLRYSNTTSGAKVPAIYGLSPMSILRADVLQDELLSTLSVNFLRRGAVPSGILHVSRMVTDQEDVDQIRRRWKGTFSGTQGQFNVGVLDAETKYEALQALPKDLALEATRDEVVARICSTLGVPMPLIGAMRRAMTYNNYRNSLISYRDETIAPLMGIIVRFLNRTVSPLFSETAYISADYENAAAWQENEDAKAKRTINLFTAGITTINESRTAMGYDTISGGDLRRVTSNVFEVGTEQKTKSLAEPEPAALIPGTEYKALEPSAEAQSPPVRTPRTGPVPIPRAQELIQMQRRDSQVLIDKLAKQLRSKYFKPLQSRISGYVGRRLGDATQYSKQDGYPFNTEDLAPVGMRNELAAVLTATSSAVLASTFSSMSESGIVPVAAVNERNKYAQRAFQQASANAARIHGTTQKEISRTLAFGLENGLTVDQIANGGILEDGTPYKGLRGLIKSADTTRVALIARTEIMQMTNLSTLSYYEEMGAELCQLIDGDQFDQRCADRNGRIVTLEEASQQEEHPNGILDFVPALERTEDVDELIARLDRQIEQTKKQEITT